MHLPRVAVGATDGLALLVGLKGETDRLKFSFFLGSDEDLFFPNKDLRGSIETGFEAIAPIRFFVFAHVYFLCD